MKHSYVYRVLTVCLLSLMLLASLCLTIGAENTDTLYASMQPIFTAEQTNALSGQSGTFGDFTWKVDGGNIMTDQTIGGNIFRSAKIAPGSFRFNDTSGILTSYDAVMFGGDVYFESFPGEPLNPTTTTTSSDPTSENFQSQSLLTWYGESIAVNPVTNQKTSYFDGLRIDSEGNLYSNAGLNSAIGIKLELNTWYNLKVLYSVRNKAEIWIDGERITTFECPFRPVSKQVRFFDAVYKYTAYVKGAELSAAKDTYYLGTTKENTADFISYQTTVPVDGKFNLRIISGLDGLDYQTFGYRVLRLEKDQDPVEMEGTDTLAYSSIRAGENLYSVKDYFGYNYACFCTVPNLDATKDHFELIVFPYTLSLKGEKIYGDAISLTYAGETDTSGRPVFTVREDTSFTEVKVSNDTYIYRGTFADTSFGDNEKLIVQNPKTETGASYRAAYFKFTIPAETVAHLSTVTNAYLRVHSGGFAGGSDGDYVNDLYIYDAPTDWDEDTLTYNTFYGAGANESARGDVLASVSVQEYSAANFFAIDILDHLKKQTVNNDGTITVAFCITHPDGDGTYPRPVYLDTKENGNDVAANIRFEHSLYGRSITNVKANNEGYEPLSYSEKLLDEWFGVDGNGGLYDKIYPKDENGDLLTYEIDDFDPIGYNNTTGTEGDFTQEVNWIDGFLWNRTDKQENHSNTTEPKWIKMVSDWRTERFARTLSTLGTTTGNRFLDYAAENSGKYGRDNSEINYGGITGTGIIAEKNTGFFHVENHNGRPYIIDPNGYPFFATSINAFVYGETDHLQTASENTYGTEAEFFTKMSKELRDMGIYTTFASDANVILNVENGLSTTVPLFGVSEYMRTLGRSQVTEGQFPYGNTINVFDPDFVTTTYAKNSAFIFENGYADNPRVFGYTADNELPSHSNILESYLTLDPTVPDSTFSYHTAWEWFARRIDKVNPTIMDYYNHEEKATLNSEFLGFIYARNYKTIRESIELEDTNHMYMGSRVAGDCRSDVNYLKAAGYYLDIITTNLYGGLNPETELMTNYYRYAGIPFIVTEFYAKAMDAIDANGYMMTNSTGAGIPVNTQEERAAYYEHFVLSLLESKACVGWSWYRFRDNDQGLWNVKDANGNTTHRNLRMLFVSYGSPTYPVTFIDTEGNVLTPEDLDVTASNWKDRLEASYEGEPMASNQNCNKGIFNADYSSVVTVYTYNSDGTLKTKIELGVPYSSGMESFEIDDSNLTTAYPADGTELIGIDGETYTIGTSLSTDNKETTVTKLTVYKGKYIALTDSIKNISDNIMNIITYLDNDEHIPEN